MSEHKGFKEPVLLATTANITLSGEQTIDGTLTSSDRVLVKSQTDTTTNGIYVTSSGAWERSTDFDGWNDFTSGTMVLVHSGSANAGTAWRATVSADPPVVGTSTITWTAFTPSSSLGGDLTALEALASTGIARRTAADTWSVGTLVTNAESANMAQDTIKGRASGAGTGVPTDLTATQATAILNVFAQDLKGLAPGPTAANIAGNHVLKATGWAAGAGDLLAANNLSDVAVAATAFTNIKQAATDAATGVVELATSAEAITGTDTARAVTPAGALAAINARSESIILAITDETTIVTSGTNKCTFRMPYAMTVTAVRASLNTAQTSGTVVTIDINESAATIMTVNKLTIDNLEKTSTTAAVSHALTDTALADDAEITVDVDAIGDGTARGLKVTIIGTRV